ncbi:MAG TPA: LptF/LptG family permease [Candidatus Sumerlaeota bacterium]|nr:LptF/LptG family permease [Candidatus Sumerlaeota bacterium]HPS00154.1 LptF/LptG family permease [Candidatus Sumerlaeota bacterium]
MLGILQRYVFREVLWPAVMSMAILTFLLLVRTVFTETDTIAGTMSAQASLQALGCLMPTLLTLTLPMSLLVGTLLGIGRLTVDSEVKAFRTHGVNLFRTFLPIVLFGLLTAGAILANSLYFAPWMMSKIYTLLDSASVDITDAIEPGRFVDRSIAGSDAVFYFKELDPTTEQMKNVYLCMEGGDLLDLTGKGADDGNASAASSQPTGRISDTAIQGLTRLKGAVGENPPAPVPKEPSGGTKAGSKSSKSSGKASEELQPDQMVKTLVLASTGSFYTDVATGKTMLELRDGTIHFMGNRNDTEYYVFHFDTLKQSMMTSRDGMGRSGKDIDDRMLGLTLTDMGDEIAYRRGLLQEKEEKAKAEKNRESEDQKKAPREQRDIYAMEAATYQRISISLACFAFVLIGVPLAIYIRPSGKSVGISVAFGLLLVFYGFLYSGEHLTRSGSLVLGPFFMFLPIVLLSGIGAYLLHRVVHR